MAHESAQGHGMTPADFPGLGEAMSSGKVGDVKLMRRVLPVPTAWVVGTGPVPIASEAFVEVKK